MVLMDFEKYKFLFAKIGARVPNLWCDTSFEPKLPKTSFSVSDPKVVEFFEISQFY